MHEKIDPELWLQIVPLIKEEQSYLLKSKEDEIKAAKKELQKTNEEIKRTRDALKKKEDSLVKTGTSS